MALKTITGKVIGPDNNARGLAQIKARLSQPATIPGTAEVLPVEVAVQALADGTYSIQLHANNDLTPNGTFYTILEEGGVSQQFTVVVPTSAGPFVMSQIMAAAPTPAPPAALDSAVVHIANPETIVGAKTFQSRQTLLADVVHSTRVATEAELVAGLDASLAETVVVTLTANRVMGVPTNGVNGHRMKVVLIEGGAGGFTLDTSAISVTNWALNLTAGKSTELPLERIAGVWTIALNPTSSLARSVAVAAAGTSLLSGGWTLLPPPSGGDDSAMIQAVIDSMSALGGGEVWGWGQYKANVVLKANVLLKGPNLLHNAYGALPMGFSITANATGYVVDTPAGATAGCGVEGLHLVGLGAGTAAGGVRFQNVSRGSIKRLSGQLFADEAVVVKSPCSVGTFEDIFVAGLANTTRAAVIAVVDIDGSDHNLNRIEATLQSSAAVTSASLFCKAIAIRGTNARVGTIVGEFADEGVYVSGSGNRFVNADADHNWGHGFNVVGTSNLFDTCLSGANGQDTTNTYDNWRADSASSSNQYSNCKATNPLANKAKYDFEDLQASGSPNFYVNCFGTGAATQEYVAQSNGGSSFLWPRATKTTLTQNSATPDVTGTERAATNNTTPTTITNFTGGVPGQMLAIFCNDSNTTVQDNGATIRMSGNTTKKLKSGFTYHFYLDGSLWRDVRSFYTAVGADVGDAAKTLVADQHESTQIWATALTANRAVTLSFGYSGARFHIVRKASATGASTLDVGTGPLKSLAVGQWCDVEHDGAAWFLSAFGSL